MDNLEPANPQADEYDLEANDNLLKSKAYILFTVKNSDGDTTFNYNPQDLSTIEIVGMLNGAIQTLEYLKEKADYTNYFCNTEDEDEEE